MDFLNKYLSLVGERPELFRNTGEEGEVKVITDPDRIHIEHERLLEKFRAAGKPENWVDIGVLAEDEWEYVVRDLVEFADGRIGGWRRNINRIVTQGGIGSVIMPVQGDKAILLKHFRHEDRAWFWEFPRGWGTPGLTAEQNAIKELKEEISLTPQKIFQVWREPTAAFFYAEVEDGEPHTQDGEAIQKIELIGLKELEARIMDGDITDWFTVLAFLMAQKRGCFVI